METKILASNAPWYSSVEFLIKQRIPDGKWGVGTDIIFEVSEDQGKIIEPTFSLSREATQELMDSLWQCGFRPSEGTGSAGQLRATQDHLADMRRLVFERKE